MSVKGERGAEDGRRRRLAAGRRAAGRSGGRGLETSSVGVCRFKQVGDVFVHKVCIPTHAPTPPPNARRASGGRVISEKSRGTVMEVASALSCVLLALGVSPPLALSGEIAAASPTMVTKSGKIPPRAASINDRRARPAPCTRAKCVSGCRRSLQINHRRRFLCRPHAWNSCGRLLGTRRRRTSAAAAAAPDRWVEAVGAGRGLPLFAIVNVGVHWVERRHLSAG